MTVLRTFRLVALATVVLLVLAACASGDDTETTATSPPTDTNETSEPSPDDTAGGQAEAELPADELRLTLEQQLGHHARLAIEAMRAGVRGEPDFEAAGAALARNTDDLTSSIELVYGAEGAQSFRAMWENHINFFVQYTTGLATGDEAAREEARTNLDQYRQDFAGFMETASEGNIPADVVLQGLQAHVEQLIGQIDAFHAGDYDTAYMLEREAYAHMFGTAQALAGGIAAQFPERFPADGEQMSDAGHTATHVNDEVAQSDTEGDTLPAVELRATLRQQLGEHAKAAMVAMRKGVRGEPDFEAAGAALARNT
ncbi:MAG: hypothetical protein WEG40_04645, partial [Candidatus Rokuibacteriota bacterium]